MDGSIKLQPEVIKEWNAFVIQQIMTHHRSVLSDYRQDQAYVSELILQTPSKDKDASSKSLMPMDHPDDDNILLKSNINSPWPKD
jgi:hypothetical protein